MNNQVIIPNAEDVQAMRDKIAALKAEEAELNEWLSHVREKEIRKTQLRSSWGAGGEIHQAEQSLRHALDKIRDSRLPKLPNASTWGGERVIRNVTDKFIVVGSFGGNEKSVTRYRRDNGWRERTKSGWDKINVEEALALWADHIASAPPKAPRLTPIELPGGAVVLTDGKPLTDEDYISPFSEGNEGKPL